MRVAGIDPGIERTGFAVFEKTNEKIELLDACRIRTPSNLPLPERLAMLAQDLSTLLAQWKPQRVAVEELFFSKNVKTAMIVAHARGVIIETTARHGCTVIEYNPGHIKQTITGDVRADKRQIKKMLHYQLGVTITRDDTLDAIACGLCLALEHSF